MPADDTIKPAVVAALQKDGWTITHDPLTLDYDEISVSIDLGGERLLAAERGAERIAIEVKSFGGKSPVRAYRDALGQPLFAQRVRLQPVDVHDFQAQRSNRHALFFRFVQILLLQRRRTQRQ